MEYRKEKSRGAVYSRTGRKLSSQEVDNYQTVESAKEQEVIQVVSQVLECVRIANTIYLQGSC